MLEPRSFAPDIFARLAPDILLSRYLEKSTRPDGRAPSERRSVSVVKGRSAGADGPILAGAMGCAVARAGDATVIAAVTGGLTEMEGEGGIYANVEIHRGGRQGMPTPEEMILSQRLQDLLSVGDIPRSNFELAFNDLDDPKELALIVNLVVLSRTGQCLDLVWTALVAALEDTEVPVFTVDDKQKIVPTSERRALSLPASLPTGIATYGIFRDVVLADPDGLPEESCAETTISIAKTGDGALAGVYVSGPVSVDRLLALVDKT